MSLTAPAISDDLVAQLLADQNALAALTVKKTASDESFVRHLELLRTFTVEHGLEQLTTDSVIDGIKLGAWTRYQRIEYRKGTLSTERITQLESVTGWAWEVRPQFEEHLAALTTFIARHGHIRVPAKDLVDGLKLGTWIRNQRTRYRTGEMTANRIAALEAIDGWKWSVHPETADYLAAIRDYISETGNTVVPQSCETESLKVGRWIQNQRTAYRLGKLSSETIAEYETIPGWNWAPGRGKRRAAG